MLAFPVTCQLPAPAMNSSSSTPASIVIATRESQLAMWQAEHVQAILRNRGHAVDLLGMTTKGDQALLEGCAHGTARKLCTGLRDDP